MAECLVNNLIKTDVPVKKAKVAILGFTFKENCPDTRNTKVIDIYNELGEYGISPLVVDPSADAAEAEHLYGITFGRLEDVKDMDAVVIAVSHNEFLKLTKDDISGFYHPKHKKKVLMDLKGMLDRKTYLTDDYLYCRYNK